MEVLQRHLSVKSAMTILPEGITFFLIQISYTEILNLSVSSRVIGQYNREEMVCYIPVGDKVHPFSGAGIQLLVNLEDISHLIPAPAAVGDPPSYLSGIAGSTTLKISGRFCSNR